jgi:hypothetical protein
MGTSTSKTKSVAAFMFLPQFGAAFEAVRHLGIVFVRILALMFAQAGLIARNHPATMYGMDEVTKTGFRELMGEGWYTLRTTRATPYQWGLYLSIVLMITTTVCSVGSFAFSFALKTASVAEAQVFTTPGNPYGAGVGKSDMNTMETALTTPLAGAMFDSRYEKNTSNLAPQASIDYALMVLDKVLRQSFDNSGSPTQTALTGLMSIYNTGILIVASIMLFWLIITIVVDTAKTGQIGGGRHNMVWAPIRIVFALGLMIPLGANGFSSGQYIVMKLAEYGSNFGSTAWAKYVDGVASVNSLMPGFTPEATTALASDIAKIKTCQVVYNAAVQQQIPGPLQPSNDELISVSTSTDPVLGTKTIYYTNKSASVKCGSITVNGLQTLSDAPIMQPGYNPTNNLFINKPLKIAATKVKIALANGIWDVLDETNSGAQTVAGTNIFLPGGNSAPVYLPATQFACIFGERVFSDGGNVANMPVMAIGPGQICPNVVSTDNIQGIAALCGTPGPAVAPETMPPVPTTACQKLIAQAITDKMNNTFCGTTTGCPQGTVGGQGGTAITGMTTSLQSSVMGDMHARGWGGMGMWYQTISAMTSIVEEAKNVKASVTPGTAWKDSADPSNPLGFIGATPDEVSKKVVAAMSLYDGWWGPALGDAIANNTLAGAQVGTNAEKKPVKDNYKDQSDSNPDAQMDDLASQVMPDDQYFLFSVLDSDKEKVYPMVALAETGFQVIGWGVTIITILTAVSIFDHITVLGNGDPGALSQSALANGLQSMALALTAGGIALAYYLPALPLVRVAMAVVTWIISVFEAVVMVPIAALAHLTTEGEGLAGGAKTAWILWLNILLRPVLVVIGFVGAMLVYNTFIVYFQVAFSTFASTMSRSSNGLTALIGVFAWTIIYIVTMYTTANIVFKMLDNIPSAFMRWFGGSPDHSYDHEGGGAGALMAGSNMLGSFRGAQGTSVAGRVSGQGKNIKKGFGKLFGRKGGAG